jgi:hypothetical protein
MDGTALKPIELDSDQEGRAEMRRTRITTNKRLREEAAAAQEFEEERKAAALAAKKQAKAANVVIKITKAQQKKLDEEKVARMKKASAEQRKMVKTRIRQWNAYNRVETTWLNRKQQAERILLNKLTGVALSYRPSRSKRLQAQEPESEEEEEQESEAEEVENDEDTIVVAHVTRKHRRPSGSVSDNSTPRKKKAVTASPTTGSRASPRLSKSASPKHIDVGEALVTDETRTSPRYNMTLTDLNRAFAMRDLLKNSPGQETREQAVARLEEEDQMATAQKIKDVLKAHGLSANGKSKAALIKRLQVYEGEEKESIA